MKKSSKRKAALLHSVGMLFCTLPPAICTLSYFPLWSTDGERCIAGGVALLLVLSAFPLIKRLGRMISSGSSYMLWLLLFILFFSLSRIAKEITVISFVGLIGNVIGALFFISARRQLKEKDE